MAAIFTFSKSSNESLAKVGVHVCYLDGGEVQIMEDEMTRISIRIEHKNLPLAASNILVEQMSPEEIRGAVASFEHNHRYQYKNPRI